MAYIDVADQPDVNSEEKVVHLIKKFKEAKDLKDHWKAKFEEAYEYCLPNRESFYTESPGDKRTDKIFDETAVVGVQEFASRLQAGITPTFARWADFQAGSEIPEEAKPQINLELDTITNYVFEVIQQSNFNQEVHESFMDLAVGTGVMLVEEGDAINPVKFTSVPLPRVYLNSGPDGRIDTIYRVRKCKPSEIHKLYPKANVPEDLLKRTKKLDIIEAVYKSYDEKMQDLKNVNEDAYNSLTQQVRENYRTQQFNEEEESFFDKITKGIFKDPDQEGKDQTSKETFGQADDDRQTYGASGQYGGNNNTSNSNTSSGVSDSQKQSGGSTGYSGGSTGGPIGGSIGDRRGYGKDGQGNF